MADDPGRVQYTMPPHRLPSAGKSQAVSLPRAPLSSSSAPRAARTRASALAIGETRGGTGERPLRIGRPTRHAPALARQLRALAALAATCASLASAAPVSVESPIPAAGRHPTDGPDIDLRVAIRESGVRAAVTLNLAFVDEIIPVTRESESQIHPVELEGLHEEILAHLRAALRVEIDGLQVTPLEQSFDCEPADETLLSLFPRAGARALVRLRTVLEFPAKSPPESVRIHWSDYPPDTAVGGREDAPPLVVQLQLSINGSDEVIQLSSERPSFDWRGALHSPLERFLAVPDVEPRTPVELPLASALLALAGLLLAGRALALGSRGRAPRLWLAALLGLTAIPLWRVLRVPLPGSRSGSALPSEEQALAIFRPLHANIYRAFDYDSESDVYDALARSVSGELLRELYDQIYSGLVLAEEGGAVCKVQRVELLEASASDILREEPSGEPAFSITARWQVEGAVYHWGHSHWRTNEYQAEYHLLHEGGGWRIVRSQILQQFRVSSSPSAPAVTPPPSFDPESIEEL